MGFHWPLFRKSDDTEELRDRLLAAETKLVALRNLIEHPRRGREIRCDAKSYKDAKRETTGRLRSELAAAANLPLHQAIERNRGRG